MTNPYAPPQAAVDDIAEPQQFAVPADRGTRLGAAIIDSILFMAAVYVPLMVALISSAQGEVAPDDPAAAVPLASIALGSDVVGLVGLIVWSWFTLKFMARNSQSIAKKWLQIKVVRADGSRVTLGRLVWLRNVVIWILSFIPLFGIIDALFIFGEARQCLHDKIADTIVIKA
jgi:uncharacterized RDD family membrane protein YckC